MLVHRAVIKATCIHVTFYDTIHFRYISITIQLRGSTCACIHSTFTGFCVDVCVHIHISI